MIKMVYTLDITRKKGDNIFDNNREERNYVELENMASENE